MRNVDHQIGGKNTATPSDRAIADLSGRQHGVVARRQLFGLGLSARMIDARLAGGRLHPVHRGVYAVGHCSLTARGRWLAAVLALGRGAVLSHRSAAALWGIRPSAASRVDVTVPARRRRDRPRIAVHVVREQRESDRARRAGIPVTSVARTLLDLAEVISERQLSRAFEEAERARMLDLRAVEDVCIRGRGRRGLGALLRVLDHQSGPAPATRSELERLFLDLCREHGLPSPHVNQLVEGFEVDAVWSSRSLVVELDGYAFHGTREAFERDRARDAALATAGYRVLRFTHRQLRQRPAGVAATLRAILGLAS